MRYAEKHLHQQAINPRFDSTVCLRIPKTLHHKFREDRMQNTKRSYVVFIQKQGRALSSLLYFLNLPSFLYLNHCTKLQSFIVLPFFSDAIEKPQKELYKDNLTMSCILSKHYQGPLLPKVKQPRLNHRRDLRCNLCKISIC